MFNVLQKKVRSEIAQLAHLTSASDEVFPGASVSLA